MFCDGGFTVVTILVMLDTVDSCSGTVNLSDVMSWGLAVLQFKGSLKSVMSVVGQMNSRGWVER
jgi:hypothetical protein